MNQVRVMPGASGIKAAYRLVLQAKKADIVCLSQDYQKVIGDFFETEFAPKLYGKVKTREILPDTAENRDYAAGKDANVNQVRFSRVKPTETDYIVTDSMVVLISFKPESAMAIVIEETEQVKFLGAMYEEQWGKAGK